MLNTTTSKDREMYTVNQYTADPTLACAELIHSERYADRKTAFGVARAGSKNGYYMAINVDDGEQIAGFANGFQIQGY